MYSSMCAKKLSENYYIFNGQIKTILIFNRYVNYKFFSLYNEGKFFYDFYKKYLQFLFVCGLICIGQSSILKKEC